MIQDPDRARAVATAAEAFLQELSHTLEAVRMSAPQPEFEKLKHAVGQVVGTLEIDLLWPLYKEHPELEPENLKGWETGA
jgi:hypothetical protein